MSNAAPPVPPPVPSPVPPREGRRDVRAIARGGGADADLSAEAWETLRQRLMSRGLRTEPMDSLSLRDPASGRLLWGPFEATVPTVALHRAIYAAREDVCAVMVGGGPFGRQLSAFGGTLPPVFDEQVRQLGQMGAPVDSLADLPAALSNGCNMTLYAGHLVVLGMTPSRLALNAELLEKCAKAWVTASAGGGRLRSLPWMVRHIANGRLLKDEERARERVRQGLPPQETAGY